MPQKFWCYSEQIILLKTDVGGELGVFTTTLQIV